MHELNLARRNSELLSEELSGRFVRLPVMGWGSDGNSECAVGVQGDAGLL